MRVLAIVLLPYLVGGRSSGRGGASIGLCDTSHAAEAGALVLDLTRTRKDEGDLGAAWLVGHELHEGGCNWWNMGKDPTRATF